MVDKERRWNRWDKSYVYRKKMDGSICFQCDTTQPEFSELNPNDLYETLVNAGYDMNAEGISTPFIYCGERFIVSEDGMDMSL